MIYDVNMNGIDIKATYTDKAIAEIFIPILKRLTFLQKQKGSRVLAYFAAPPEAIRGNW